MDPNLMPSNRTNLKETNSNSTYITLTVILVILSIIGVFLLFQMKKTTVSAPISTIIPTSTPIPTVIIESTPTLVATISATATATPTVALKPTTTLKPTATPKPTSTPKPTATSTPTATPTPSSTIDDLQSNLTATPTRSATEWINYENKNDGFSVSYNPTRKILQDTESSGNRYTFTLSSGNFAVHVGTNNWSWTYPERNFTTSFPISSQSTFRYDVVTQTIVDIEYNNKKYTLQCVHNGIQSLKDECEKFLQNFRFL